MNQRARWLTASALTLLILSHGGCGFALRGSASMPQSLQRTHVQAGNESAALVREIARQLAVTGGTIAGNVRDASATLVIVDNESGQRVLSLTTTGGPEEYEVFHIVRFELVIDGKRIYGPETVTLTRDYTFNKNDILGKRREYDTLRQALQKDIVSLMLRRLSLAPEVS